VRSAFVDVTPSCTIEIMEESLLLLECRKAELDFLASAYTRDEVWWECDDDGVGDHNEDNVTVRVRRRLVQRVNGDNASSDEREGDSSLTVSLVLELIMTPDYPLEAPLQVSGRVDEAQTDKKFLKRAFDALPSLVSTCRKTAESLVGGEAVFPVLSAADDWMNDMVDSKGWIVDDTATAGVGNSKSSGAAIVSLTPTTVRLGRRLIYSHHIISSKKRADLKRLFVEHDLTGYVKIGWPGLIIVEGREGDCQTFCDIIRRWAWQYLVVRGEMQEEVPGDGDLDSRRVFPEFLEVQDMSIVADHCRRVGLDALFRTSMKNYGGHDNDHPDNKTNFRDEDKEIYGALVSVDHFNNAKSYRKWLYKTGSQLGVGVLVKKCLFKNLPADLVSHRYDQEIGGTEIDNSSSHGRPLIVVVLVGDAVNVSSMLKKWRTTRVDVDSRGKLCLERMMSVLREQPLERRRSIDRFLEWENKLMNEDEEWITTREQLIPVIESIGGKSWVETVEDLFSKSLH